MKARLLILLTSLLVNNSLCAQPFLPIVKENAIWSQWLGAGAFPDPPTFWNWTYKMIGDTAITGLQYKKLFKTEQGVQEYVGAMRETEGRVYMRPDTTTEFSSICFFGWNPGLDSLNHKTEVLIYDFNLALHDTFYDEVVISVDYIDIGDGANRKRLRFYNGGWMYWIEGIGSEKGLLEWICPEFENEYGLNCYQDSTISYLTPCSTNVSVSKPIQNSSWTVSPNPTRDYIVVNVANRQESQLMVRDMLGELVLTKNFISDAKINLKHLNPALYTITLFQQKGLIETKRFVITR